MDKAIFIDKDGTLVKNDPFNINLEKVKLYPDVQEALCLFKNYGFKIVVISNQPGISFGYFNEFEFIDFIQGFYQIFNRIGCRLDGFYYCPHDPKGKVAAYSKECSCRKPNPGMLIKASEELNIDLSRSWMIGDILNDVEAGKKAGCKTILIDNGNETEWVLNNFERKPLYILKKISAAARKIIDYEDFLIEEIKRGGLYEGSIKKFDREF